jgi:hypothetical protein
MGVFAGRRPFSSLSRQSDDRVNTTRRNQSERLISYKHVLKLRRLCLVQFGHSGAVLWRMEHGEIPGAVRGRGMSRTRRGRSCS